MKFRARFFELLAQHTGRDIQQIETDTERDRYLTPEEAKDYGIVDEILTQRDDQKGK